MNFLFFYVNKAQAACSFFVLTSTLAKIVLAGTFIACIASTVPAALLRPILALCHHTVICIDSGYTTIYHQKHPRPERCWACIREQAL